MSASVKLSPDRERVDIFPFTQVNVLHQEDFTILLSVFLEISPVVDGIAPLCIQRHVVVGLDDVTGLISFSVSIGLLRPFGDRGAVFIHSGKRGEHKRQVAFFFRVLAVGYVGHLVVRTIVKVKRNGDGLRRCRSVGVYLLLGLLVEKMIYRAMTLVEYRQVIHT